MSGFRTAGTRIFWGADMRSTGDRTVPHFLEFHAAERPHEPALLTEFRGCRQIFSWQELNALADRTAHWILSRGLQPGQTFVIHLSNCLEAVLFWLAAAKSGTVCVPVNPASTPSELAYLFEHSEAAFILTREETRESVVGGLKISGRRPGVVLVESERLFGESALGAQVMRFPAELPASTLDPLDFFAIMYTSGTTGRPKGVQLTHASYVYGADVFARCTYLGPQDRHLICLPLYHAAAQVHALTPSLIAGASVAVVERFSSRQFFAQALRTQATRAALFGAPLRMLLSYYSGKEPPRTGLRLVTFAQSLTEPQLAEWNARMAIPLMQLWGMTETVGLPIMVPQHGPRNNMSMGMPVAGYECKVVDEEGRDVPDGTPGELVVRAVPGWTTTSGYYKNPEATAELMRNGWLYSGDRVVRDASGQFFFLSRFKELIKRAGENVSPLEVEAVLCEHPQVHESAVVGVPDAIRDEAIVAFVIPREGDSVDAEMLQHWCHQYLTPVKVPEKFVAVADFPRTSVGKVQRHLLQLDFLQSGSLTE